MSFMKKFLLFKQDNNILFDEYQALKEYYDALLLQLTEKDETIQGLQDCKQNLEMKFSRLQMLRRRLMMLSYQAHLLLLQPLMLFLVAQLFVRNMLLMYVHLHVLLWLLIMLFLLVLRNTLHVLGLTAEQDGIYQRRTWENGQGIVVPITPEMKSPRIGLGYDVVVASLPTPDLAATRKFYLLQVEFRLVC
jgi:hypothetical protein